MAVMHGVVSAAERTGAALAGGAVLLVGGSVAASSLLAGYPVLGGQAVRYAAAGLLLAGWARLRGQPLPRPVGREWSWLVGLAAVGLAGCSVLLIQATRVADPAAVGVVIGAAPLLIALAGPITAGRRPAGRVLVAAAVVAAGAAAAQVDVGTGRGWSVAGLLLSLGALAGVAGTSLLAAPVLPRLGALAVSVYACGLAGAQLLAAAALVRLAGGPPVLLAPTATELAALTYLAVAVTAVVFLAWYAAVERLGVARTGLFNGLIPVASLAAVAVVGTGTVTSSLVFGAVAVLAGLLFGLTGPGDRADRPGLAATARRRDLVPSATSAARAGAGEGTRGTPISTHLEPERSHAKFVEAVEAAATAIDRPPQPSPRLGSARRPSAT
jgi:drug/metabolite transporter (DMT)-like permease